MGRAPRSADGVCTRALSHAVALAPESAAVKVALAGRELTRGNLVHAAQLLAAVKELPPGPSVDGYIGYSLFLMGVGRPKEAIEILERLRQPEPLAPFPSVVLQIAYELSGEYEAADSEYERSVALGDTSGLVRGRVPVDWPSHRPDVLENKVVAPTTI